MGEEKTTRTDTNVRSNVRNDVRARNDVDTGDNVARESYSSTDSPVAARDRELGAQSTTSRSDRKTKTVTVFHPSRRVEVEVGENDTANSIVTRAGLNPHDVALTKSKDGKPVGFYNAMDAPFSDINDGDNVYLVNSTGPDATVHPSSAVGTPRP